MSAQTLASSFPFIANALASAHAALGHALRILQPHQRWLLAQLAQMQFYRLGPSETTQPITSALA